MNTLTVKLEDSNLAELVAGLKAAPKYEAEVIAKSDKEIVFSIEGKFVTVEHPEMVKLLNSGKYTVEINADKELSFAEVVKEKSKAASGKTEGASSKGCKTLDRAYA